MIEKAKQLAGKCSLCGKIHPLITSAVHVGEDATDRLIEYLRDYGGRALIVCDENTKKYTAPILDAAESDLFSLPGDAHATEITTAALADAMAGKGYSILVACGSGSLHDTVRYTAAQAELPFVSYPTAASVDGFVSGVAAMTWHGLKQSFSSRPPVALFADDRVYTDAPARLTASGAADILGKYTALADWRIAHLVSGEMLCEAIFSLEREALDQVAYAIMHREEYDTLAYCKLVMNGLILSGLAMQLQENSRPASGSEHHLSHFWEMHLINAQSPGLHGEMVGVGLLHVLYAYRRFASRRSRLTPSFLTPDLTRVMERMPLEGVFGDLTDGILSENMPHGPESCSLASMSADIGEAECRIREVLAELPSPEEMAEMLRACGAPASLSELHLPEDADFVDRSLTYAPYVRNRLTLLKMISADRVSEG